SGVGLVIGSLIKNIQGAIMTGVGIAVVTSAISGIFFPYSMMPAVLQKFSQIWPMSASNSSIITYLIGDIGYNPLTALNFSLTIAISLLFFTVGVVLYTVYCWRSE
ncbi:MAG: ABC transporter permease, partial [Actinobacteria bacterium]|nr:ABC transporter permease [Actinomycetota bacterium]